MSLNAQEMENTRYELAENFRRTGLTEQQVADDLGISFDKIAKCDDVESTFIRGSMDFT